MRSRSVPLEHLAFCCFGQNPLSTIGQPFHNHFCTARPTPGTKSVHVTPSEDTGNIHKAANPNHILQPCIRPPECLGTPWHLQSTPPSPPPTNAPPALLCPQMSSGTSLEGVPPHLHIVTTCILPLCRLAPVLVFSPSLCTAQLLCPDACPRHGSPPEHSPRCAVLG